MRKNDTKKKGQRHGERKRREEKTIIEFLKSIRLKSEVKTMNKIKEKD